MKNNNFSRLLISTFILLNASTHVEAGRPLNTDDSGIVSQGIIETTYTYAHASDDENNLSLVLTTGLLDSLDFGIEIPYQFIGTGGSINQNGVSDISLTTKWNFFNDEELFDMALSFNYKSDNGNDEKSLGTGKTEHTILAIVSKDLSGLTIHLNTGPTIVSDGDDVINYNLATEWGATEKLTLVSEIFGSHNFQDGFADNSMSGLLGAGYDVSDNVVYDIGFIFGISDAEPDFKVTTGFTFEFGD